MHSTQTLTTLFCLNILDDPVEASHITLNLPLKSVSAQFRGGFENSNAMASFTIAPKHCLGSILVEADGQYWSVPKLFTWNSLEQHESLFQKQPAVETASWKSILEAFASVEIVRFDSEWDMIDIFSTSGRNLTISRELDMQLRNLP